MEKEEHTTETDIENLLGEWKRSMLTFWALSLILTRPMYGLEVKREIETSTQGKVKLGTSTIYQLLRRLEKKGFITSRWEQTVQGPPRAYYETTAAGREVVRRYLAEVFVPGSPIAAALGVLMEKLFRQFPPGEL